MEDVSYRVLAFADLDDVQADGRTIRGLLEFEPLAALVPTTFQEVSIRTLAPVARVSFASPDMARLMQVASDRVTLEVALRPGDEPVSRARLLDDVRLVGGVLGHLNKAAHRLALHSRSLFGEVPEPRRQRVFETFVNAVPYYREGEMREWSVRTLARPEAELRSGPEAINVISIVSRVHVTIRDGAPVRDQDRFCLDFDINTIPEVSEPRFRAGDLDAFFSSAVGIREELTRQLEGVVDAAAADEGQ